MEQRTKGGIFITLGMGVEFFIDDMNQMGIRQLQGAQVVGEVWLGPATEDRLDRILLHMGSLRIHTERN